MGSINENCTDLNIAAVHGTGENGYGIFGTSTNQAYPGIFGENTAQGDAIFGKGTGNGRGVVGTSENHTGVEGNSNGGDGVFGTSQSGRGVVGVSQQHTGVEGHSSNGVGIWGSGKIAGHFEGNVEIQGILTVNGVAVLQIIQNLQQQIKNLSGSITGGGSSKPSISVTKQNGNFRVTGSGFLHSTTVHVRVVVGNDITQGSVNQTPSSSTGTIDITLIVPGNPGVVLHFSANDGRPDPSDLTGTLWSNTVDISE